MGYILDFILQHSTSITLNDVTQKQKSCYCRGKQLETEREWRKILEFDNCRIVIIADCDNKIVRKVTCCRIWL